MANNNVAVEADGDTNDDVNDDEFDKLETEWMKVLDYRERSDDDDSYDGDYARLMKIQ